MYCIAFGIYACVFVYVYEQCADLVFDEMQRIAAQCESTELSRFPALKERVVEVVHGKLYIINTQYALPSKLARLDPYMLHIVVRETDMLVNHIHVCACQAYLRRSLQQVHALAGLTSFTAHMLDAQYTR